MTPQILWSALAVTGLVASLFFLKFWRASRDRLFLAFAAAFTVMTVNWMLLALLNPSRETGHFFYLPRLLAFLLILAGIVDKNRRA